MFWEVFALHFCFLLCSLLVVFILRADDHSFPLEARKQAHFSPLGSSRHVCLKNNNEKLLINSTPNPIFSYFSNFKARAYLIQNKIPLLASSNLNKLPKTLWCSLQQCVQFSRICHLLLEACYLFLKVRSFL